MASVRLPSGAGTPAVSANPLEIGSGGPKIKITSSVFEFLNNALSAFLKVRALKYQIGTGIHLDESSGKLAVLAADGTTPAGAVIANPSGDTHADTQGSRNTAISTALGSYSTTAQMNTALALKPNKLRDYDSGNQTISNAGALTLAHGLAATPTRVVFFLKCINGAGANGYALDDELPMSANYAAVNKGFNAIIGATNIEIKFGAAAQPFSLLTKSDGTHAVASNSDWAFVVRAWL